jgi:uncharacterized protein YbaR (Trm112 family)
MAGSRRPDKLPFRELPIVCPYCKARFLIGTVMDVILASRRTCPECAHDFMIENDIPRKLGEEKQHRSAQVARTIKAKLN